MYWLPQPVQTAAPAAVPGGAGVAAGVGAARQRRAWWV